MSPKDIKMLRLHLGLNREDFGKKMGVSGRTVEKYEQGTFRPSPPVMMHLKRILSLTAAVGSTIKTDAGAAWYDKWGSAL